jgi:hypothetical protein
LDTSDFSAFIQVHELHRLYRIQRDLMDEFKRKEFHKTRMPIESSLSSSPLASQITSDARKWHIPSFPLANSVCARPSVSGVEDIHSTLSSIKGNSAQGGPFLSQNGGNSKDLEVLDARPSKVRRKTFDLQLPADEYIDTEEGDQISKENVSGMSSYHSNRNHKVGPENGVKLFPIDGRKSGFQGEALTSDSCLESRNGLADLNEPIQIEETNASGYVDVLGCRACHLEVQGPDLSAKPNSQFLSLQKEISLNSHNGTDNGTWNSRHLENNGNGKGWFSHMLESGMVSSSNSLCWFCLNSAFFSIFFKRICLVSLFHWVTNFFFFFFLAANLFIGHSKSNLNSASQGFQPEISSQPMQVLLNKAHESSAYYLTDQSKIGLWNERTVCALEMSDRGHEISSNKHLGSIVASHSPYTIAPSSWSHSVSSWERQSSSLSQKSISVQKQPCLNSSANLSKSSQSSVQSNGFFGDAWHLKSNPSCDPAFGSEVPNRNGFYHGSSSGSKEPVHLPSISYDYLNSSNDQHRAPDHFFNNGMMKYFKGSDCMDMNSVKDENVIAVLSNSSSNKVASQQGFEMIDGGQKHEEHLAVLPWFRPKPASKNQASNAGRVSTTEEPSFLQFSTKQFSNKIEKEKGTNEIFTQNLKSDSCSNDVEVKRTEGGDYPSNRKILGFPIFEKSHISKNESSSFTSPSVSLPLPSEGEVVENNGKNRVLDINLPCEPAVPDLGDQVTAEVMVKDKKTDANVSIFRHNIDLNSSIGDDETSLVPSIPSTNVKITVGIDLEAPVVVEAEEDVIPGEAAEKQHVALLQSPQHKAEHPEDDFMMVAAEAIVAISSTSLHNQFDDTTNCNPLEASVDRLNWFVEIVSSCGDDIESKFDVVLRVKDSEDNEEEEEGSDYFEFMTLKLIETKEEDYMPRPLVPENLKLEETGATLLPNRARKGQARRGRQRRDFQRDILPGLASLSRHEVTEDLQTFGGLMRATGHLWHSGLTRRSSTRNGCGRGRRRSVASSSPPVPVNSACTQLIQQLNNVEVGLEDRSLTGWGKTTRRPRRQRCPAGNHTSIPLT